MDIKYLNSSPMIRQHSIQTEQQVQNRVEPKMSTIKELTQASKSGQPLSISDKQIVQAIERATKALEGPYTTFDISVHEQTNAIVVKVLDRDTGEVIREIPREKTLDLVAKMMEIAGILVDEKR